MEEGHDKVSHTHCRQSPALHSFSEAGTSPIDNFLVEGVGGLRCREWSIVPTTLGDHTDSSQCSQIHTAWVLLLLTFLVNLMLLLLAMIDLLPQVLLNIQAQGLERSY